MAPRNIAHCNTVRRVDTLNPVHMYVFSKRQQPGYIPGTIHRNKKQKSSKNNELT